LPPPPNLPSSISKRRKDTRKEGREEGRKKGRKEGGEGAQTEEEWRLYK
jgi:hypothetical protein